MDEPPTITIGVIDPDHADAVFCLRSYFEELDTRFDTGFDPDTRISATADEPFAHHWFEKTLAIS